MTVFKGWQAKIYIDGIEIGCALDVTLRIKNNMESYYGVDDPNVLRFVPGEFELEGTLRRAWINCYYLNLLLGRDIKNLPFAFDLILESAQEEGACVVYLYGCRFSKGTINIPQDGWLEEHYDFIVTGYRPGENPSFPDGTEPITPIPHPPIVPPFEEEIVIPIPPVPPYSMKSWDIAIGSDLYSAEMGPSPYLDPRMVRKYDLNTLVKLDETTIPRYAYISGDFLYVADLISNIQKVDKSPLSYIDKITKANIYRKCVGCTIDKLYVAGAEGGYDRLFRINLSTFAEDASLWFPYWEFIWSAGTPGGYSISGNYIYLAGYKRFTPIEPPKRYPRIWRIKISPFGIDGSIQLSSTDEDFISDLTISGNYLYSLRYLTKPKINKIYLPTFTSVATLELDSTDGEAKAISISGSRLFVALKRSPQPRIVEIDLATFSRSRTLDLPDLAGLIPNRMLSYGNYLYLNVYSKIAKIKVG